jgi:hypothetical protein
MMHPDTQLLMFMGTAFPLLHHPDLPHLGLVSFLHQPLTNDNETSLSHSSWDRSEECHIQENVLQGQVHFIRPGETIPW